MIEVDLAALKKPPYPDTSGWTTGYVVPPNTIEQLRKEAIIVLRDLLRGGQPYDEERVQLAVMILKELWPPQAG